MSALVVDTSSWVAYFAGSGSPLIEEALEEGRVHLPPVVAAELLSGKLTGRQDRELAALLADLPLCPSGFEHWCAVGRLRRRLRASGLAVSTPDAHVAQCTLELEGALLTEDRVFHQIARHVPLRLA